MSPDIILRTGDVKHFVVVDVENTVQRERERERVSENDFILNLVLQFRGVWCVSLVINLLKNIEIIKTVSLDH